MSIPLPEVIQDDVCRALAEDIGTGDISAGLVPSESDSTACLIAREPAILCGCGWFNAVFLQLDPHVQINWFFNDADTISPGARLCELTGHSRALLSGERTAINFLQLLSGTATTVASYVALIRGSQARLLDTRKTVPGLRKAQKYAVSCGGGENHRLGLYDACLIKENHILARGGIVEAVTAAHQQGRPIEIEVEDLKGLEQALSTGVDRILLDNFPLGLIRQAVRQTQGRAKLEVSGNINMDNIRAIADTGVDYISVGALTKNVRAIDFSMRIAK